MKITRINVSRVTGRKYLLGYANVTFDNAIAVNGIKIVQAKSGGRFISMPSYRNEKNDKKHFDIVFPVNTETRSKLTTAILNEYDKLPVPEPESIEPPKEPDPTNAFGI